MSAPGQKHKSFASELRAELVSSISDLTMHGPSKVASTTNILRRMFWVCIVLVGWTACVLLTVQYVNQYLAYETVTNIAIRLDQKKPNFPAVTICGVRTPDIKCLFDQGICTNDIVHLVNTENFFGCSAFNTGNIYFSYFVSSKLKILKYLIQKVAIDLKILLQFTHQQKLIKITV